MFAAFRSDMGSLRDEVKPKKRQLTFSDVKFRVSVKKLIHRDNRDFLDFLQHQQIRIAANQIVGVCGNRAFQKIPETRTLVSTTTFIDFP